MQSTVENCVERQTPAPGGAVLDTLVETAPDRRRECCSNATPRYFEVHDSGPGFLEVTEGTFMVGHFWERSRYEWSLFTPRSMLSSGRPRARAPIESPHRNRAST